MAWVTQEFIDKWYSGRQIGADTPHAVVQVQRGKWGRGYFPWHGPRIRAAIPGEPHIGDPSGTGGFWRAHWIASTDWIELPNLLSVKRTRDFQAKGITVLAVVIDAIDFEPKTGALGDAYHVIAPGYLAAWRGRVAHSTRPNPHWHVNEFEGIIEDGVKIRVWQGLGEPETDGDGNCPPIDGGSNGAWTFVGQIDQVDLDAGDTTQGNPNQIQITARNGKLLTDQTLFGWTKSLGVSDPVTFADDRAYDTKTLVGYRAKGVNYDPTGGDLYRARNVLAIPKDEFDADDPAYSSEWRSLPASAHDDIVWLEIRLPQGRYEDCLLVLPPSDRPHVYIAMHVTPMHWSSIDSDGNDTSMTTPPTVDGRPVDPGWIGHADVPGTDWKYLRYLSDVNTGGPVNILQFLHTVECGARSTLRIGFTHLPSVDGRWRARARCLHGRRRKPDKEARSGTYVLVPDASEPVKTCLRWCGYQEWEVEETHVRLNGTLLFNRTQAPMDVIQKLCEQTGFIFFIADPTDANSEGVPTFRKDSSLLRDNDYIAAHLRDDKMLTGCKRADTDEDRVFIIRVRGTSSPPSREIPGRSAHPDFGGGYVTLGGEKIKRVMATYIPPWGFTDTPAGVLRRIIYQDDNIQSFAQCTMACILIGLNAALAMHTVQLALPAHPIIELDDQVTVLDEATATNSRVWVTKHEDTMTLGDQQSSSGGGGDGTWTATIEGALMDTDDFAAMMSDALNVDWVALSRLGGGQRPLPGAVRRGQSRKPRVRSEL